MTEIKLDTQALNALFPEGSEARVKLQNAVIFNFVSKNFKTNTFGKEVEQYIIKAKTEMTLKVYEAAGLKKGEWSGWAIPHDSALGKEITLNVRNAMSDQIRSDLLAYVETCRGTIKHDVEVAVGKLIDKEVADLLKARLKAITDNLGK